MKLKSEDLVRLVKSKQDRKVLDYFYQKVFPKVKNYVSSNGGSFADSQDVFQEAIMSLYSLIIDNKTDRIADFEGFLIVVSRNKWVDSVRKKSKETKLDSSYKDLMTEENPLLNLLKSEKMETFKKLFNQLSDTCQSILNAVLYQELSMSEISVQMNLKNSDAAKTAHYRCKQKLIEIIQTNKGLMDSLKQ